jgi:CO/xanthine dehydrogenase Mo-binding subunit
MSETAESGGGAQPLVVEREETKPGYAGTNVPRKEDKRLVQGQGVFFDDVKRHGMGFVHFVRSPYAHAKIVSVDVSEGARARRRLRHAARATRSRS